MKYEVHTGYKWVEVTRDIFRSWTGDRKKNGLPYNGPVFYLGSNKKYKAPKA